MPLLHLSDHTFAAYRSEHSIRLDDIVDNDDDDDFDDDVDDDDCYLKDGGRRCGLRRDQDVECSSSTTRDRIFIVECATPSTPRPFTSLEKAPPTQDSHCLSSPKQSHGRKIHSAAASLNKRRFFASLLHESLSEMLNSSQRDIGISALDNVAKNIECLAREEQKEKLADLLTERLRGFNEPENGSDAPNLGPHSTHKLAVIITQKGQLVDALADVFAKNEGMSDIDDGKKKEYFTAHTAITSSRATHIGDAKFSSSRTSDKRRPSSYSDVSSITSRTTASLLPDSPRCALFRLPVALNSCTVPKAAATTSAPTPTKQLKDNLGIALQDSFSTVCSLDSEDESPKRPQRRGSSGEIILHDSFSSFSSRDFDVKAPIRPQRHGSLGGATSDAVHDGAGSNIATATLQPPQATRSLDDVAAGPRAPRRPGARRKSDVRAAPPQRQRSFDGEG